MIDSEIPCEHGNVGQCLTCNPGYSLSTILKGRVIDHEKIKKSLRELEYVERGMMNQGEANDIHTYDDEGL